MNDAALFYELADRLDRIEHQLAQLNGPIQLWIPKKKLAEHLGVSVRWIDYRVGEGLPHREIAGEVVPRPPRGGVAQDPRADEGDRVIKPRTAKDGTKTYGVRIHPWRS